MARAASSDAHHGRCDVGVFANLRTPFPRGHRSWPPYGVASICIMTAGHVSTCPRMVKAADALAAAGHMVRVVAARFEPWAAKADHDVRAQRSWPVTVIDRDRRTARSTYWTT